ncbi:MMPL family transporter [Arcanobacterium phocisimile]|uniref:MMPL family transporter n=1 Tax=Arcanobacterium phocisimile TaxID=1302235 RepID=A0ABX7IIH6_9ACTO|nr:MMPL family transporter [Arcanobacterium phocisimile]QRV02931.1 MMPL family transporter [Arcanobacterium phocisimile]
MFTWLSHKIPARPKTFILFWAVLAFLGISGALVGFGQGNLFERMSSSESMIPDSESDIVLRATGADERGESIIVLVENTTPEEISVELSAFREKVQALPHVASVNDPQNVDERFKQELAAQIDIAVEQAISDNQEFIDQAAQGALQSAAPLLEQARSTGGPEAEYAAREQIIEQATTEAQMAIAEQARTQARQATIDVPNPAKAFTNGNSFVLVTQLDPGQFPQTVADVKDHVTSLSDTLNDADNNITVSAVSATLATNVILDQTAEDLVTGETVGLPIALVLLVVVFGGAIAAGLPLGSALISIAIGLGAVWTITFITNVDNFILNIVTLIGLALSIDYGLLVVSRYREEIAEYTNDPDSPELKEHIAYAIQKTITTAGRTVAFSALTIALAISGLLFMNAPMLRMIAIGGVIVTLLAVATAITLVPALIVVSGRKLVAPSALSRFTLMRFLFVRFGDSASDKGIFSRLARWVQKRPWQIVVSTLLLLGIIAAPVLGLTLRSNFTDYLPQDSEEKHVIATVDKDFPAFSTPEISLLAHADVSDTTALVEQIKELPSITGAREPVATDNGVVIGFDVDTDDAVSKEVTDLVSEIRGLDASFSFDVGGPAALQMDFASSIASDTPIALGIVIASVVVLLFFMTGSIIAPLTALVINSLSLLAGLGGAAFLFNHGLFGLPQTSGIETFVVATAIAFGFGLAMDYEVFLLARIKEYWDLGESNDMAVEHGLQRSGRIITSAAAIIIAVFIGFVFGELVAIKQIGVVLAIIVVVDATIVRMLLVPAMMTILGKWNWWAPRPLRKLYKRFAIHH